MNERIIPPAALRDPEALEVVRVWIAERGLHVSLWIGAYKDTDIPEEAAWGIILADIARHVSRGLSEEVDFPPARILERIVDSFRDEIEAPTSKVTGELIKGHD